MRKVAALAAVAASVMGLAAVALADSGSKSDPSGDVKHNPTGNDANYDIVRIAYGHDGSKLVNTIKVAGHIMGPGTQPGPKGELPPLLWIDVPGKVANRPGCKYSDYLVDPNALGEVEECGEGPTTGPAQVEKVNAHTLRYTFKKGAIGNPSKYGIAGMVEGAQNGLTFFDRGPDTGFLEHHLG